MGRTRVTAAPVPALLINNTAEGLEGGLSSEDAAERSRRKKEWKEVAGTAMAGWQAIFASGGGLPAVHQRGHRGLGTGVFHVRCTFCIRCSKYKCNACASGTSGAPAPHGRAHLSCVLRHD